MQETAFSRLPPFPNGPTSNIFLSREIYNGQENRDSFQQFNAIQVLLIAMLLDGSAISSVGASSTLHVMDQCHLLRDLKVLNIELVTYLRFQSQHFSWHIILEIICATLTKWKVVAVLVALDLDRSRLSPPNWRLHSRGAGGKENNFGFQEAEKPPFTSWASWKGANGGCWKQKRVSGALGPPMRACSSCQCM